MPPSMILELIVSFELSNDIFYFRYVTTIFPKMNRVLLIKLAINVALVMLFISPFMFNRISSDSERLSYSKLRWVKVPKIGQGKSDFFVIFLSDSLQN